ncbi:transporter [Pseudomonas aeruginosa]|nr:transporter [Pseudomonas aeruginosa]RQF18723.1 transporter [Pseudomonas aeruginosa]RUF30158.1 transporter [Pseudomonas aeruginosa]
MKQGTFRVCHADFYSYRCVEGRPRQLLCRTTLCRSAPAKGWFERAG